MKFRKILTVAALAALPLTVQADSAGTSGLVQAAPQKHQDYLLGYRWVRRATLAASCVAGTVIDTWALHRVAANPNLQLSGMFISNGKPQYGELIGILGGSCALSTFLQEKHVFAPRETRGLDLTYTFENLGSLGFSMWETSHLLSLANQGPQAARVQPGTLSVNR
ncbi:MAG TPA: hypothetical protein VFA04_00795 [Bryobacteraceae bacterium]|nr:hypothetical protein [Bryobacteraceae bacterium]